MRLRATLGLVIAAWLFGSQSARAQTSIACGLHRESGPTQAEVGVVVSDAPAGLFLSHLYLDGKEVQKTELSVHFLKSEIVVQVELDAGGAFLFDFNIDEKVVIQLLGNNTGSGIPSDQRIPCIINRELPPAPLNLARPIGGGKRRGICSVLPLEKDST